MHTGTAGPLRAPIFVGRFVPLRVINYMDTQSSTTNDTTSTHAGRDPR